MQMKDLHEILGYAWHLQAFWMGIGSLSRHPLIYTVSFFTHFIHILQVRYTKDLLFK